VVNPGLNAYGEPILCTPTGAFRCFVGAEIERLAIGKCYPHKEDQHPSLKQNSESRFGLD
jgi:carbamoyltransferase